MKRWIHWLPGAATLAAMMAIVSETVCILAGIGRLGFVTDLLSKPIRYGYMSGIALTVLISQLPKFFGFIAAAIVLFEVTDLKRIYRIQQWEFRLAMVCLKDNAKRASAKAGSELAAAASKGILDGWLSARPI